MEEIPLTRRERERSVRKEEMLRAAQAVFAEKGYGQATIDEIAHRAEFGKGTLYNYFPGGKEDILFSIFDHLYDTICERIEAAFSTGVETGLPFRDTFSGALQALFEFFLERQDLFMLLIKEAQRMFLSDDPEKAAYFMRQRDRVFGQLLPPVEAAMKRGEIKNLSPVAVAHMIWGNVYGIQVHLCIECTSSDDKGSSISTPAAAAEFLTTILMDGLTPRQPTNNPTNGHAPN